LYLYSTCGGPHNRHYGKASRIVLSGVNSLRGNGSDEELYEIAKALIRHRSLPMPQKPVALPLT
jgi:hypothetical protein